jgi:hypothetical protein
MVASVTISLLRRRTSIAVLQEIARIPEQSIPPALLRLTEAIAISRAFTKWGTWWAAATEKGCLPSATSRGTRVILFSSPCPAARRGTVGVCRKSRRPPRFFLPPCSPFRLYSGREVRRLRSQDAQRPLEAGGCLVVAVDRFFIEYSPYPVKHSPSTTR